LATPRPPHSEIWGGRDHSIHAKNDASATTSLQYKPFRNLSFRDWSDLNTLVTSTWTGRIDMAWAIRNESGPWL